MSQPFFDLLKRLDNSILLRFLLFFASGWALILLLNYLQTVVIIFVCASILSFLLNYPTRWLQRFVPRPVAALLVFWVGVILLLGILVTVVFAVVAQGPAFVNRVTEFFNALTDLAMQAELFFKARGITLNIDGIEEGFRNQVLSQLGSGFTLITEIFSNVVGLVLILVISFFMLLDYENFWATARRFVPVAHRDRLAASLERNFLGFFLGRFLLALFLTGTSFIVFVVLKIPQPLLLALIAGVFDLIPGIGATLGITLISLILLPQGPWKAGQVLVSCIVLQQIEENMLMPRVMQQSLQMSPVVVFLALLVGARIAGLFGLFLAIPLAGVILSLIDPGQASLSAKEDPCED
ncbi:AI-2E family transporter [Lyngbya confervoides]|uniref:AI-2E family transporter n=1 Tax=Lyngbya confervoides BDU141951 TaxID=1574623 RepID=A0ABD4T605_9CYAN|nr:AI-2E family transporter [Lyngbya confervoides]MCM1983933.1 AI-2E family transporter [Lyngbya confervoides BDU141951]